MLKRVCGALVASFLVASAAQAQITNGDFESGVAIPDGSFVTLFNGDTTSITGWTVIVNSVDYIGTYWQAADGNRSVDLSGNAQGGIYQFVDLAPGWYTASFAGAANPDSATDKPNPRWMTFSADSFNQAFSYTLTGLESRGDMNWLNYTTDRFYSDGNTKISFISGTVSPYGFAIDNVSLNAIPEPATWALMLIGFAFVGSRIRRRRHQLVVNCA